jgi:ribonuclease HI
MHRDTATLSCDGGSRGNPGPSAIGVVIELSDNKIEFGQAVGVRTNNEAEYLSLIAGLRRARELGISDLTVRMDSLLVVKQMNSEYKVKAANLKPLYLEAIQLSKSFKSITFTHVVREKNKEADRQVNLALDSC